MRCRLVALALAAVVLAPAVAAERELATAPAVAIERKTAEGSLLFSRRVLELLGAARRAQGDAPGAPPPEAGAQPARPEPVTLHLSAILYQGPGDWKIWLNGRSLDPGAGAGPIEIRGVQRDFVRLRWRGAGTAQPAEITLRPNQTYIVGSGEILEGPPSRARRAPQPTVGQPPGRAATRSP